MIAFDGIVILGFPRSGTTLLRRLLDAHSQVDCPGESYLLTACARFLDSYTVAGRLPIGVESGLATLGFATADLHQRLRGMVFDIRRQHLAASGKKYWAEKTAVDAFHLDPIERLFGDHLAFILIHRHGLDVCASVRDWCEKSEAYPPELHAYIQRHSRPLEAFAHAWVDVSRQLKEFLERRRDRTVELHYEDLIADPRTAMEEVLRFLGLSWEDGLVEQALSKSPHGFGDWKTHGMDEISRTNVARWKRLPRPTIDELAPIVNPTLVALGYEALPAGTAASPEEALRRYQLGLQFQRAQLKRTTDN